MLTLRKSAERGYAKHGWLESYHSFSFAEYLAPDHMGYSVLRVINEDVVAAGTGFGLHPHRDMEIVTYIVSGELRHQDSMGNTSVIRAGDVQRMTAGTGVRHSEINPSLESHVHLLQIWILPNALGLPPSYEEKHFSAAQKSNQWCLIAGEDGEGVKIHQDVKIFATNLSQAGQLGYALPQDRCAYLQVVKGSLVVETENLAAGDALMIEDLESFSVHALENTEVLLFDLPKYFK